MFYGVFLKTTASVKISGEKIFWESLHEQLRVSISNQFAYVCSVYG